MKFRTYQTNNTDAITWLQIHNLLPIVFALVSVISAYFLLANKVEVQQQRINTLESNVQGQNATIINLQTQLQQEQITITQLQATKEVKGVASTPTPQPLLKSK